jgi:hypothetical protein
VRGRLVPGRPLAGAFAAALVDVLSSKELLSRLRAGAVAVAREMTLDAHLNRLERIFEYQPKAES